MDGTTVHDIYDPPPASVALVPEQERMRLQAGDVAYVIGLGGALAAVSWYVGREDAMLGGLLFVGGLPVLLESWFTGLSYLQREDGNSGGRWRIFVAALAPWAVVLLGAAGLMLGLFLISDWLSG